jgi:hypothetical protein
MIHLRSSVVQALKDKQLELLCIAFINDFFKMKRRLDQNLCTRHALIMFDNLPQISVEIYQAGILYMYTIYFTVVIQKLLSGTFLDICLQCDFSQCNIEE